MLIGPTVPEEAAGIARLGFTIVESLKVLGFSIDNKADKLEDNFNKAEDKIRKIIGIWPPYKLSF